MKILYSTLLLLITNTIDAHVDSTKLSVSLSGYMETYYNYDLGKPSDHNRPGFIYSHNRHNEVNLNIGFIKAAYTNDNMRANLALMTGTYANANLAAEPGILKNIFEANTGVKVSKKKNIWIDAGIFASHIGFESAVSKDCWNLTRSILADNSPYYETGLKVSYTSNNEKWYISGLILNGWQRIQRANGNSSLALGHQLTYKPNARITLNSSSFIGSDTPDSIKLMRYFHNFYGQIQLTKRIGLIVGFDIGAQQKSKKSKNFNAWYSPVLIVKYKHTEKISISARGEYYTDANGVIVSTGTLNGFQTYGYSINLDYNIMNNVVWRIESRAFTSKDKIFRFSDNTSTKNYFLTTSIAIAF